MFKLLKRFIKPYLKNFIFATLGIVIESFLELSCPFLMNLLLENGIEKVDETYILNIEPLIIISSIMLICGILAFIFGNIFARNVSILSRGLGYELRKEEYKHLKECSFKNLDSISTSSLLTRLTSDVTIISDTINTTFRPLFRSPVMFFSIIIVALTTSFTLSIIFLITFPFAVLIMFLIIKNVKPKFIKIQSDLDKVNRTSKESIISIKTIKSYVKEDYELERFNSINEELKKSSNKATSINQLMMPAQELVVYSTVVGLLFLGGYLSLSEEYASIVIKISMFLTYVMQLLATVQMLGNVALQFNRAEASVSRVKDFFNIKSEIIDKKDSLLKISSGNLEFKNVYFSYYDNDNYVLSNINFKINIGETIGIIGQTGSSKSSLINLILRFYDVSKGEILIDNQNIKDISIKELRNNITICFQNSFLFNDTILNNIKRGKKDATLEEVIEASKIACCYDFITNELKDGFNTVLSEGGINLSGGQRQRISIARAILLKPKILILDDSFSALDRLTEKKLKENLDNYLKDTTKIIISQKISTIKDSSKILVLDKGKISNFNGHNYLKDNDLIYKDINDIQNEGI